MRVAPPKNQCYNAQANMNSDGEKIKEFEVIIGRFSRFVKANIQKFTQNIQKPNITSFKYSKLVGVPVNLVNETFNNRHGIEFYISEKTLNNRFINGERIDIDKLDFGVINSPHKEIKYEFKKTS